MTTLAEIEGLTRQHGLAVVGAFWPSPEDDVPQAVNTIVLLGPDGPGMWQAFSSAPEHGDGGADPMDRWSRRIIDGLAVQLDAETFYPFGGPPWRPFLDWAKRGEGANASPVGMLVSAARGLWISYRGALGLKEALDLGRPAKPSPCPPCAAPCASACPVDAFKAGTYDVEACASHLRADINAKCHTGCLVRRACPAGAETELPQAQRAFHMAAFLGARKP